MKKAGLFKGLAAFLVAAVFLTYLSFQLETIRTPRVYVGETVSDSLEYKASATAVFTYDEVIEYELPLDLWITEVSIKAGDSLSKGMALFHLDPESVTAAVKTAEQTVEDCQEAVDALAEDSPQRVSAQWALAQAEEDEAALLKIQEDGNSIRMDCDGDILEVLVQEPGIYPAGTLLARWTNNTASATLTWQSSDGFFLPGDKLTTKLAYDSGSKDMELEITVRRYLMEQRVFEYEAAIPPVEGSRLSMSAYEQVSVQMSRVTGNYRALVPVSALTWQTNNNAVLYTVVTDSQTKATTVKKIEVTVGSQDGSLAAVDKQITDPIVLYSDRPLTDGEKVLVEETQ